MSNDGQDLQSQSASNPNTNQYLGHQKQMLIYNSQYQHQQQVTTTTYVTQTSATTNSDYSSTSDDYFRDDDDENLSHHLSDLMPNHQLYFNEALLAVASAEEYAAKILALQQACLRPLKEDLADWLNKIMSTSVITRDNFMHKLDNGVIICRLAKIISVWCLEKLKQEYSEIDIDETNSQEFSNKISRSINAETPTNTTVTAHDTSSSQINFRSLSSSKPDTHHADEQPNHSISSGPSYLINLQKPNSNNIKQHTNHQKQSNDYNSNPTPSLQHHTIPSTQSRLSLSSTNVKDLSTQDDECERINERVMNYNSQRQNIADNEIGALPYAIVSPLRHLPSVKRTISTNHSSYGTQNLNSLSSLRSTSSQSTNCLNSLSNMMMNASYCSAYSEYYKLVKGYGPRRFLENLIQMDQTKIWEDARCRTFYARDNVCNFIRWSKEFGVNQSVLFESDDLVLHANPRQVVLCLLDVARIACVKHGFTEAPGLVKFEQQIEAEAAQTAASAENAKNRLLNSISDHLGQNPTHKTTSITMAADLENDSERRAAVDSHQSEIIAGRARLRSTRGARGSSDKQRTSIGDATDELILRYCKYKEEQQQKQATETARLEAEAANQQVAERAREAAIMEAQAAASALLEAQRLYQQQLAASVEAQKQALDAATAAEQSKRREQEAQDELREQNLPDGPMLISADDDEDTQDEPDSTSTGANCDIDLTQQQQQNQLKHQCERVDSLDSGEGRTESASTSQTSRATTSNTATSPLSSRVNRASSIPTLIRRTNSNLSLASDNTSDDDDLSSSRSSLLSGNEDDGDEASSSSKNRHDPMDLDGKVMRIAKSYYGKGARRGVTRLSEGKYKIADRIVFVRLLKGHRVMVRIGGGWDTLENFLFRHKSDPSQVIDVDNLLPLETKMSFEKNQTGTATKSGHNHRLPFYKRSDSASSTNLSLSNRSIANSPTSSSIHSLLHSNINNPSPSVASSTPSSPIIRQQNYQAAKQSPFFLINRGQNLKPLPQSIAAPANGTSSCRSSITQHQYSQVSNNEQQQLSSDKITIISSIGSRIPQQKQSSTHKTKHLLSNGQNLLLPATLTSRPLSAAPPLTTPAGKHFSEANKNLGSPIAARVSSTQNLNRITQQRQNIVRSLGRSNDSLQQKASTTTQKRLAFAPTSNAKPTMRSSSIQNLNTRRKLMTSNSSDQQRSKMANSKLPTSNSKIATSNYPNGRQ